MSAQKPLFQILDPQLYQIFASLCRPFVPGEIERVKTRVRDHLIKVRQALTVNEFIDIETAQQIARTLLYLIDAAQSLSEDHQALVMGAAEYFISAHDAEPDFSTLLGFDDDVTVLNYVVEKIGRNDLRITL